MANLYTRLSTVKFLQRKYSLKFLFVAFIGIHIPLIIITIVSITGILSFNTTSVLLITLAATLAATAGTLYFLNKLLWPLKEAKNALGKYLAEKTIPQLPTYYEDEAGILLRELQQTIEQLDYLIGEKKDVITVLSHDIRTPFNQILGLTSTMLLETDPGEIHKHAQTIKEVSVKNLMIINDILNLLKSEYALETDNGPVELNEMVTEACRHLLPSTQQKSITIHIVNCDPVYTMANRVLLAEALTNIVSNAIKFSYPGGNIEISIEERSGAASIQVKDYGIGIAEADKADIFKRFTSAGRQGTNGEHSSGVGLYLSRKIIAKSKGHLLVSSEGKDKGSTFTILLPIFNHNLN